MHLDGTVAQGGSLTVESVATNESTASGDASAVTLVGGAVGSSTATASPQLTATIANSSRVTVTGAATLSTTSQGSAQTTTNGVAVGIGVGFGEMDATSTFSPSLDTHIGTSATIVAGSAAVGDK